MTNRDGSTYKLTGQDDVDRLMELLKEYSEKLKQISYDSARDKQKRMTRIVLALIVLFFSSFLIVILYIFLTPEFIYSYTLIPTLNVPSGGEYNNGPINPVIFAFFLSPVLVSVTWLILDVVFINSEGLAALEAREYASIVIRLVASSSQYSEHSTKRLSNKFEFDLRLGEADAAIQMYKTQFSLRTELDNDKYTVG